MVEKTTHLPQNLRVDHNLSDGIYIGIRQIDLEVECTIIPEISGGQDIGKCGKTEQPVAYIDDANATFYIPAGDNTYFQYTTDKEGKPLTNGMTPAERWEHLSFRQAGCDVGARYWRQGPKALTPAEMEKLTTCDGANNDHSEIYAYVLQHWETNPDLAAKTDLITDAARAWLYRGQSPYLALAIRTLEKLVDQHKAPAHLLLDYVKNGSASEEVTAYLTDKLGDPTLPAKDAVDVGKHFFYEKDGHGPHSQAAHDLLWKTAHDPLVDLPLRADAAWSFFSEDVPASEKNGAIELLLGMADGPASPGLGRASIAKRIFHQYFVSPEQRERAVATLQRLSTSSTPHDERLAALIDLSEINLLGHEAIQQNALQGLLEMALDQKNTNVAERCTALRQYSYYHRGSLLTHQQVDLFLELYANNRNVDRHNQLEDLKTIYAMTPHDKKREVNEKILAIAKDPTGDDTISIRAAYFVATNWNEDTILQSEANQMLDRRIQEENLSGLTSSAWFLLAHGSNETMKQHAAEWLIQSCARNQCNLVAWLNEQSLSFSEKAEAGEILQQAVDDLYFFNRQNIRGVFKQFIAENRAKAEGRESHLVITVR